MLAGAVKTLNCLNVCENPLQFPPKHITDRGLVAIMKCLKQTEAVLAENNYQLESFTNSDPSNSQHFFEGSCSMLRGRPGLNKLIGNVSVFKAVQWVFKMLKNVL